ncbi:DUF799 domain-containing protein [Hydrocarboniphaga effusa]|jgi:hypothetical protein|uniref:DUF799 domain-containing protein n=1 Tax=Hydrocarboniphaga effusa TaxID=243629 RepID=UPI0035AFF7A7
MPLLRMSSRVKASLPALLGLSALLLTGCATQASYDYTAFRASRPQTILILPPVNASTSVEASYSMLSQLTMPLAESGYYVLPVTLVDETFRQNGLSNPADVSNVPVAKLHQIFGADAALYINVTRYGTSYKLINSESVVAADAKLVDLRSGNVLWEGNASASSAESRGASNAGLVGLLVEAIVSQIVESSTDASHNVAAITSSRLLAAGRPSGMLYGPRSPNYQKE